MKKLFALLLALTMVFALAACGDKDPAPSGGGTNDPGTSQQSKEPSDGDKTPTDDENPGDVLSIADCNKALEELGVNGFVLPGDITPVQAFAEEGSIVYVRAAPVEQNVFEQLAETFFTCFESRKTTAGKEAAALEEVRNQYSTGIDYVFEASDGNGKYSMRICYYLDGSEPDEYAPKTMIMQVSKKAG